MRKSIDGLACMTPATGDSQILAFLGNILIDLMANGNSDTREILKKLSWMVAVEGTLPVKQYNGMVETGRPIAVYPNPSLFTVFDFDIVNPHGFDRGHLCELPYCHKSFMNMVL